MAIDLSNAIIYIMSLPDRLRYLAYKRNYELARSFSFNGRGIEFYGDGEIIIGEGSYVGRYSSIQSISPCKVHIGKKCAISHYVMIYTSQRIADQDLSNDEYVEKAGDVTIKDYCWIGAHVFINPGITIGENSVVGANSVVTKDIPPYAIAGGCPAKIIKYKSIQPP